MFRVAIIEDEKFTALDLADTLKRIDGDIEIVAILASVKQAVDFLKKDNKLDLLFSDIQLPDGLSFDIFKTVSLSVPVIFCTAYDQYALDAFETNGIDYILKPFSKESVSKALDKYHLLKQQFSAPSDNLDRLIQMLGQSAPRQASSVIVYQGDKIIPVETKSVALFFLEDSAVFALTFEQKRHLVSHTLEELEGLCGAAFFRANRQHLVNRKAVKDAARYLNRKIVIHLNVAFQDQILVGKLKTSSFLEWLAKS